MAKNKITEEEKKEIKTQEESYYMLEKTKNDCIERGNTAAAERVKSAMDDVVQAIRKIDPTWKPKERGKKKVEEQPKVKEAIETSRVVTTNDNPVFKSANDSIVENLLTKESPVLPDETTFVDNGSTEQYDVIPLPSNGEGYKSKTDRLPVAYLTAYDENLLTSPNLYRDGLVIDFLLKNKVMNKSFNVDDLLAGDADAIIWFLRTTSYGADFPITVRDPETGNEIESVVDLSKLKQKEFKLTGDENGHFSYTLPISKKEVKFRFLTRADEKKLLLMQKLETEGMKSSLITEISNNLKTYLETDEVLSRGEIADIERLRGKLDIWADKLKEQTDVQYLRIITNRLEMQVQAVDGDYDRENIKKFIMNMPAKDSLMLRRYIIDNEPGMDFEIEVERPASLGGGSFKTFLEWDDNVFLNIS